MAAALSFLNAQPQFNHTAHHSLPVLGLRQSSRWFNPLEIVVRFFAPEVRHPAKHAHPANNAYASKTSVVKVQPARKPRVHVLRVSETDVPAGSAGRMRMSGRFSDVCAELDRLVAIETRPA